MAAKLVKNAAGEMDMPVESETAAEEAAAEEAAAEEAAAEEAAAEEAAAPVLTLSLVPDAANRLTYNGPLPMADLVLAIDDYDLDSGELETVAAQEGEIWQRLKSARKELSAAVAARESERIKPLSDALEAIVKEQTALWDEIIGRKLKGTIAPDGTAIPLNGGPSPLRTRPARKLFVQALSVRALDGNEEVF